MKNWVNCKNAKVITMPTCSEVYFSISRFAYKGKNVQRLVGEYANNNPTTSAQNPFFAYKGL